MTRGNTRRCRTRNGPRRRRTLGHFRFERHPVGASIRCREKLLGSRCARPSFFGRHRDRTNPQEFQAHVLEEFTNLAGTTSQSGQLKDPFTGLGDGADGLFLEGLANQLAISGHLALRAIRVPPPQAIQATLSKRGHVSLNGGPTDADDLSRVLPRGPMVQQPDHEHFLTDTRVWMSGPFLVDDSLLLR